MMEQRRGRLRLEVVCRAAQSDSEPHTNKYRKVSGGKLDAAHISKTSLSDTMQSLLPPSLPRAVAEGHRGGGTRPYHGVSVENSVRELLKEFTSKGLGGLCLTCVWTGEDHESHDK